MTGRTSPADPAKRIELVFTPTKQLITLLNGTVIGTTPYALIQKQSMLTKQLETFLVTDPGNPQQAQTIRISATTLGLGFDAYDASSETYHR